MRRIGPVVAALLVVLGAALAFQPASGAQGVRAVPTPTPVGCGTDTPTYAVNLNGLTGGFYFTFQLYDNQVRIYNTYKLVQPGTYEVFSVSMDNHVGAGSFYIDPAPFEQYRIGFDVGLPTQVVTPAEMADLPTQANWQSSAALNDPVPLFLARDPVHPFGQLDPPTPGNVTATYPGYPLGNVVLTDQEQFLYGIHKAVPRPRPLGNSITPWYLVLECTQPPCDPVYTPNTFAVDDPTPSAGQSVNVTGAGFAPGDTVNLVLRYPGGAEVPVGSTQVAPDSTISTSVVIPADAGPGEYKLIARSVTCPLEQGAVDLTVGG